MSKLCETFLVSSERMYNSNNDNNNRKFPGKTFLANFENKRTFIKKAVLHTINLMHCKAKQVLSNLFSINKRNDSETTFVAGATKTNLKNLKI